MTREQEEIKTETKIRFGEWQLCPKCNGEGKILDNSYWTILGQTKVCDVCNGAKILARPIIK